MTKLIKINPGVRFGKPIIAGTRIPVELVVGKIAGGMEVKAVITEYDLTREQVLAALQYAAAIVSSEQFLSA